MFGRIAKIFLAAALAEVGGGLIRAGSRWIDKRIAIQPDDTAIGGDELSIADQLAMLGAVGSASAWELNREADGASPRISDRDAFAHHQSVPLP